MSNSLNPNKKATRAEVAAFLCQALVNSGTSVIPEKYIANRYCYSDRTKIIGSGE